MNATQAKKLREPFKAEQIGKLPKPTRRDNQKGDCKVCGGWHGLPAIHLDYVGHAAVTDRLLDVDPAYEFKPSLDDQGYPIVRGQGQSMEVLYSLTVCGVTRYEWGEGPNMKECESDAIRRCAMRFGVALDLWSKEDLQAGASSPAAPATGESPDATGGARRLAAEPAASPSLPAAGSKTLQDVRQAHASAAQMANIRAKIAAIKKLDAEHEAIKTWESVKSRKSEDWEPSKASAWIDRLAEIITELEAAQPSTERSQAEQDALVNDLKHTFDATEVLENTPA